MEPGILASRVEEFSSAMPSPEVFLVVILAHVCEGQDGYGFVADRGGRCRSGMAEAVPSSSPFDADGSGGERAKRHSTAPATTSSTVMIVSSAPLTRRSALCP